MNLNRLRQRLTLGYVGIFAAIFFLVGAVAVAGFARELTEAQDDLLAQEARNTARNLLEDDERALLATDYQEFSWVALDPDGRLVDSNASYRLLGLPAPELARQALEEDGVVAATIQGQREKARVVSMPYPDGSGEPVGVIQYGRSLGVVRQTVGDLVSVLLPLGLGALGLATIGGSYMARRSARPVREAFERQRAFVADASHELKTPLTLIRADAEVMLFRGNLDEEDRALAEHALAETDRMGAVLSNLLTAARLDAGKLEVADEPFDLAAVLSEEAERFGARAAAKEVRLEVHAPGELPARGDAQRTGQILAALLDNAVGHTPPGGRITLSGEARGRWAEANVADTGPGIAGDQLPRIFDRFYRGSSARTRDSGGAGLGLAIARELARAQGGDLVAENAKGGKSDGGATFRLRLPRTRGEP